ncbi:MAG: DmsE family decaheme c-type cytochrome [Xanthomonadales bacterium]|nr:DmsE family decaheme c-type cytochrome [Xanthomonadales bacterium]
MISIPTSLVWIALLLAPVSVFAEEPAAGSGEYTGMAPEVCLNCHGETSARPAHEMLQTTMARKADPASPFGGDNHSCESCHGPSKAHVLAQGEQPPGFRFDDSTTAEQKNETCIGCHREEGRFHWPGATHNLEGVACIDCHNVHQPEDPVLALETQSGVCFDCHKKQRADFLKQSRHPVQTSTNAYSHAGMMACSDCHNPHGNGGAGNLTRNTVNETCYDCHAEKRGPFLFEHQPAREDCATCHEPHGSNYPNMLVARTPWLCQQCHVAGFHPSGVYGGSDVAPGGADQRVVGKDCLNCHNKVHGSNHPSGIRLTR